MKGRVDISLWMVNIDPYACLYPLSLPQSLPTHPFPKQTIISKYIDK